MLSRSGISGITSKYWRTFFGVTLIASPLSAWSANLGFLNDTPISYMTQRDIDSAIHAVLSTLDAKSDGESTQWTNRGLGNGVEVDATLTPEDTQTNDGRTCRFVAVVLRAKGQSLNLHPQYCRTGNAQWELQKRK